MLLKQLRIACCRLAVPVADWRLGMVLPMACVTAVSWAATAPPSNAGTSATPPALFNEDGSLQLPTGYRQWQHVGARVKTSGNSVLDGSKIVVPQLMNVYVEPAAFEVYRSTGKWPEGTRIVKEFSAIKTGQGCDATSFICATPYGFGVFEDRFIGLGMMVKDSRRFPAQTGHWGYFSFLLEGEHYGSVSPVRSRAQCSACHEAHAAASDYVFSETHIGLTQ
jgi:predicted CXXCH cytochrome family protein